MASYTTNGQEEAALAVLATASGKTAATLVKQFIAEGIRAAVKEYSNQLTEANKKVCKPYLR